LNKAKLIGYACVSNDNQLLDLQRDALTKIGCERVFEDTASGTKAERGCLTALQATLRRASDACVDCWYA
jgi:DNA invertase Pin-like site-specific DNA recombinase